MTEHVCEICGYEASCLSKLTAHQKKKLPCDGKYKCNNCHFQTKHRSNLYQHRKTCKGSQITKTSLQKENNELRTVLAATGNQRLVATQTNATASAPTASINDSHDLNHSGHGDIVGRDQINNITNNITVNCAYKEDIEHIKKMTLQELKSKIGCLPDLSTHVKLFDLIRTSDDHPENHTMLLPDLDGKTVHYKTENGWQSAPYNQRMLEAFLTDNKFLIESIPESHQDQIFYQGYLLGCNFRAKDDYLMPYYDACRKSLHGNTMKLAESHSDFKKTQPLVAQSSDVQSNQAPAMYAMTYKEAMDLEETKLKVAKEMADLRFKEAREAKETAQLRMKEKEWEYKILIAKQQVSI